MVLFFVPYATMSSATQSSGQPLADYQTFAVTTATALVIVVSVQVALDTAYWTIINHIFVWGSLGFYVIIMFGLDSQRLFAVSPNYFHFVGSAQSTLLQPVVWSTLALATTICIVPVLALRFLKSDLKPQLSDTVRYAQLILQKKRRPAGSSSVASTWCKACSTWEDRLQAKGGSRRSGYAFSHQEGFGELITSGKNMASFAPKHSSSWVDTLLRKKRGHGSNGALGECTPAVSHRSPGTGSLQDSPIREERAKQGRLQQKLPELRSLQGSSSVPKETIQTM